MCSNQACLAAFFDPRATRFLDQPFSAFADFEGMFLQVEVFPKDRPSLGFLLWRKDPTAEVEVFEYHDVLNS